MKPIDQLYGLDDVAEKLKINRHTVLNLACEGELVLSYRIPNLLEASIEGSGADRVRSDVFNFSVAQARILMGNGEVDISEAVNIYVSDSGPTRIMQFKSTKLDCLENLLAVRTGQPRVKDERTIIKADNVFVTQQSLNDFTVEGERVGEINTLRMEVVSNYLGANDETHIKALTLVEVWRELQALDEELFRPSGKRTMSDLFTECRKSGINFPKLNRGARKQ